MDLNLEKNHPRTFPKAPLAEKTREDAECFAALRLIRSHGIGPQRFFQLYHRYKTAQEAVLHFKEATASLSGVRLASSTEVEKEIDLSLKMGIRFLFFWEEAFPSLLKTIHDPPPVLSLLGTFSVLKKPLIGIVGSRHASLLIQQFIQRLFPSLGEAGFSVVSGLAQGIDKTAHEASLAFGTVAVLAGGVDQIYPPDHKILYEKIQENGCLISEMPLGTKAQGPLFPRRNRLISGMALGVLVAEAKFQSGSMITAQYALEQGREVFSIPGSPMDPRCCGSNFLLKQGATLVTRAEDILSILEKDTVPSFKNSLFDPENSTEEEEREGDPEKFLNLLGETPLSPQEVQIHLSWSPQYFNAVCSQLELEGKIISSPQGLVRAAIAEPNIKVSRPKV